MPEISDATKAVGRNLAQTVGSNPTSVGIKRILPSFTELEVERGNDGIFRLTPPKIMNILDTNALRAQWSSEFQAFDDALNHDPIIGPQINMAIGTELGATVIRYNDFLHAMLHKLIDDNGLLEFSEEKFEEGWKNATTIFLANSFRFETLVAIPGLDLARFPLRLDEGIVIDLFSEREVSIGYRAGLIQSISPTFFLVEPENAVGIRRTVFLSKIVYDPTKTTLPTLDMPKGSFGCRHVFDHSSWVDDILLCFRLLKRNHFHSAGVVTWCDDSDLVGGMHYRAGRRNGLQPNSKLKLEECTELVRLWDSLKTVPSQLKWSLRRFSLALGRDLIEDRIVDFVISAEALLLSDSSSEDRGEIRYRFSLRGAKFLEGEGFSALELFRIFRLAYDWRSAVAHGGRLPEKLDTPLRSLKLSKTISTESEFSDLIEDLVRTALKKTILISQRNENIFHVDYWNKLILENK